MDGAVIPNKGKIELERPFNMVIKTCTINA